MKCGHCNAPINDPNRLLCQMCIDIVTVTPPPIEWPADLLQEGELEDF